jgi:hypothetical protein
MPPPIHQQARARFIGDQELSQFNQLCSFYTVTVILGPENGATSKAARMIRPEPFVCRRITWATSGDTWFQSDGANFLNQQPSIQGRATRVRFGDAFTTFLGQRAGLVSAVFGDSNGFLDLTKGIVFGGSQNLEVELNRLFRPGAAIEPFPEPPQPTRWDFVFAGVSLLPKNVNQPGSE